MDWRFIPSTSLGGHPPALLMNHSNGRDQSAKQLRTPNFIIGGTSDVTCKKAKQLIRKNSTLYIFSDGVYEIKKLLSFKKT